MKDLYKTITIIAITGLSSILLSVCVFGSRYVPRTEYEADKKYRSDMVDLKLQHIIEQVEMLNKKIDKNIKAGVLVIDNSFAKEGGSYERALQGMFQPDRRP